MKRPKTTSPNLKGKRIGKPDPVKRKADGMFITIRFNKDEIGLYRAIEWYAGHFSKPGQKCKHSTAVKRLLNAYLDGKELPG